VAKKKKKKILFIFPFPHQKKKKKTTQLFLLILCPFKEKIIYFIIFLNYDAARTYEYFVVV